MRKTLSMYELIAAILTAMSGAGKGTLVRILLRVSSRFEFSISATTRKPREGEVNGKHYHFFTHELFDQKITEGYFFEYKEVFRTQHTEENGRPNLYGTPLSEIYTILERGKIPLLDIDVKGALELMSKYPNMLSMFITPDADPEKALKTAAERLRKDNNRDDIEARLEEAKWEIEQADRFHYQVLNEENKLIEAAAEMLAILNKRVFHKEISIINGKSPHNERVEAALKMNSHLQATIIDQELLYRYVASHMIKAGESFPDNEKDAENLLHHLLFEHALEFKVIPGTGGKPDTLELWHQGATVMDQINDSHALALIPTIKQQPIIRSMVIQKMWNMVYDGAGTTFLAIGDDASSVFPGLTSLGTQNKPVTAK